MVIGFDCDEVLARYIDSFVEFHNTAYGTSLTMASFSTYSLERTLGIPLAEETRRLAEFHESRYFGEILPYSDAVETISELKGRGLVVVTSRQEEIIAATHGWVERHFSTAFQSVHFARYHGAPERPTKVEICQQRDVTDIVEDSLEHALACAAAGVRVFLVDKPWNKADTLPDSVIRIHSLREMREYL